jgi:hypothetical protein
LANGTICCATGALVLNRLGRLAWYTVGAVADPAVIA